MTARDILGFLLLPISRSPNLPLYHLRDSSVDSGHREKMETSNIHPFPFVTIVQSVAVKNMEGEFEVSEGLFESAEGLLDLDIYSHFSLDMGS